MNTEYANMAPAALAGLPYVHLCIDEASAIRQVDPLPAHQQNLLVASWASSPSDTWDV